MVDVDHKLSEIDHPSGQAVMTAHRRDRADRADGADRAVSRGKSATGATAVTPRCHVALEDRHQVDRCTFYPGTIFTTAPPSDMTWTSPAWSTPKPTGELTLTPRSVSWVTCPSSTRIARIELRHRSLYR
jgi:hypothetical protein